jgi:hypothetical protein
MPSTRTKSSSERGAGRLALAVIGATLTATVVMHAQVVTTAPPPQPPLEVTPAAFSVSAGDQVGPRVSGDWATYTDFNTHRIRYYNFVTGIDAQIPAGPSDFDHVSDISGSRIVFSRSVIAGSKTAVMLFDASTPAVAPVEIDPAAATSRFSAAIGGDTVAYVDYGLHVEGEVVIHDLATSTSVRITSDVLIDENPSVSDDGTVVTWDKCLCRVAPTNIDIWQAVKTGPSWSVSVVANSPNFEESADTNGTLVAYDSVREPTPSPPPHAGFSEYDAHIYWRPVAGGNEVRLQIAGDQRYPRVAGDFITFEGRPSLFAYEDVFVYDVVNNRLFQITGTPGVRNLISDIAVLPDGRVRLVWQSASEDASANLGPFNVNGVTVRLPNIAPTLSYSTEAGFGTDGVNPDSGSTPTTFAFKVVYGDFENHASSFLNICIDGVCRGMNPDPGAAGPWSDGSYKNGEQYRYTTTLQPGSHGYYFEASDGTDTVRFPSSGVFSGPTVSGGVTPPVLIADLVALITSLHLKHGIDHSLIAKLQNALAALIAGNNTAACNKLAAFINEVQAQSGKAITTAQAAQIVALINQIRTALGC